MINALANSSVMDTFVSDCFDLIILLVTKAYAIRQF